MSLSTAWALKSASTPAWEYEITGSVSSLKDDKGNHIEAEFLTVVGDSKVSYLKAYNMTEDDAASHFTKLEQMKGLLRQALADGELSAKEAKEMAALESISERTLWNAVKELGIITSGGPGSKWTLPNSANSAGDASHAALQRLQSLVIPVVHHGLSPAELTRYPDGHFNCGIFDPPWFGQKNFGGSSDLSKEDTIEEPIEAVATICHESARALDPKGTLWVIYKDVLRDKEWQNIPAKIAERVKQPDIGLKFRHNYVWDKSSGLSSVKDRLRDTNVSILGFVKQDDYYFNDKVVRVAYADGKRLPHPDKVKQGVMENRLMTDEMKARACARIDETSIRWAGLSNPQAW